MSNTNQSTQADFEEVWEVSVGKDKFHINEKQVQVLKKAMDEGNRGTIWFKDFAISIPHIQTVTLISRTIKNRIESHATEEIISEEEQFRVRAKMEAFKHKFIEVNSMPKKMTQQEINTRRNELLDQAERLQKMN